jgi:ssDNA-binding Zn-finger/Zn-ribbon topoisomerase 1
MPRRIDDSDHYQGGAIMGMRLTFGEHVLCPTCKGSRVAVPMSNAEKREQRRHTKQGVEHTRWVCPRCNGDGIIGLND